MANLSQQILDNHKQAAITQQALRNNRRVIGRPSSDGYRDSNFGSDDEHQTDGQTEHEEHANVPPIAEANVEPKKRRSPKARLPADVVANTSSTPESVPIAAQFESDGNVVALPNTVITLSPLDLPTEHFSAGLDRRKKNRDLLMQWLSTAMVEDVDFGRIHVVGKDRCQLARIGKMKNCMEPSHWSKPCLFKPGAEKITGMLGMTVHYPSLREYESAALGKAELQVIVLRCELHDAYGNVVAEGIGARDLKQDWGDINKSLKMCAKSAHIDATLRLAGISAMFTQDLEDKLPISDSGDGFGNSPVFESTASVKRNSITKTPGSERVADSTSAVNPGDDSKLVNQADLLRLREAIANYGFTEARVLSWLLKSTQGQVTNLEQLTRARYAMLCTRLQQWAENQNFRSSPDTQ